jgi:hypothetical protein
VDESNLRSDTTNKKQWEFDPPVKIKEMKFDETADQNLDENSLLHDKRDNMAHIVEEPRQPKPQ